MPREKWDGEKPVCILDSDTCFWDMDEIDAYCEDLGAKIEDFRFVICEPQHIPEIDINDHCCDLLCEGREVEDRDVLEAVQALNNAIKKAEPLFWVEGKVAAIIPSVTVAAITEAEQ